MDLRKIFFDGLLELAKQDKDVILLVGDLGYSFMEEFQQELPEQFINAGIAEQNMMGVAAGLALGGKKPYVYSGSIFAVCRPYEQVRDDIAYANLNVKIIGTGASGFLGFTHNWQGLENENDLLKNLPNLTRHYPKTPADLGCLMSEEYHRNGPAYIRL